jgi:hypothetical protein
MQVKKLLPEILVTSSTALKKSTQTPKFEATAKPGRVFTLSFKGIPRVTAEGKKRLEAAARANGKRRDYPQLVTE